MNFHNMNKMIRQFLNEEIGQTPSVFSYIQALTELMHTFQPHTLKEKHNLSVAKQHLNEIKRQTRKLHEQLQLLEEQVKVLEESKEKGNK